MTINFGIRVITSEREIAKNILDGIAVELNNRANGVLSDISHLFRFLVKENIEASPEYNSIINGELRTELGIPDDPTNVLQDIINHVIDKIEVRFNPVKVFSSSHLFGSMSVTINTDIDEIISSVGGSFETERGTIIPWLEWMLKLGDEIIVRDYHIVFGKEESSRTGNAVMFRGGGWRVPPQFSGNEDNNFITRSVDKALKQFEKDFAKAFRDFK